MVESESRYCPGVGANTSTSPHFNSTLVRLEASIPSKCAVSVQISILIITPEQITYLQDSTHLNPTPEEGIAFERGTAVQYDTTMCSLQELPVLITKELYFIYTGDIIKQTKRALLNIEVLLYEANMQIKNDVAHLIMYLRDTADYQVVHNYLSDLNTGIPMGIAWTPVCRLGWLIVMECIAVKPISVKRYAEF